MRSERRRQPFSRDSIERALQHHELTGAVHSWSPPEPGRPAWLVTLISQEDRLEFTGPQVYALCCGLAAGERAAPTAALVSLVAEQEQP